MTAPTIVYVNSDIDSDHYSVPLLGTLCVLLLVNSFVANFWLLKKRWDKNGAVSPEDTKLDMQSIIPQTSELQSQLSQAMMSLHVAGKRTARLEEQVRSSSADKDTLLKERGELAARAEQLEGSLQQCQNESEVLESSLKNYMASWQDLQAQCDASQAARQLLQEHLEAEQQERNLERQSLQEQLKASQSERQQLLERLLESQREHQSLHKRCERLETPQLTPRPLETPRSVEEQVFLSVARSLHQEIESTYVQVQRLVHDKQVMDSPRPPDNAPIVCAVVPKLRLGPAGRPPG